MKKRIFLPVVLILIFIQYGFSQLLVGVRGGVGLSNVSTPDLVKAIAPDIRYMPGFEIGLMSEYLLSEHLSLQGELIYREKGFRIAEQTSLDLFKIDFPLGVRVDTRLHYLDLPLQLKYTFGNGPIRGYLSAGPQIGYALNGRINTRANFLVDWELGNIPINFGSANNQRFDVSGVAGAGVEFDTGHGNVFADVRYTQGFMDSFDVPLVDFNIKHHGFSFGIGYKMPIR